MKKMKIATIKERGDVVITPLARSFYCRYCRFPSECKGHRNGFWFLLKVEVDGSSFYIIDGYGETENSTFIDQLVGKWQLVSEGRPWPKGLVSVKSSTYVGEKLQLKFHSTVGNWDSYYPLPFKFEADEELEEKIKVASEDPENQIDTPSLVEIMKIIQSNLIRKYHLFDHYRIEDIELAPEFLHFLPLLRTYKRSRIITLTGGAVIEEIANSFTAIFRVGDLEFKIPKKRRYSDHNVDFLDGFFKYGNLSYLRTQDKIVAYYIDDKYPENFTYLIGREKYKNIVHNTVHIRVDSKFHFDIEKILSVLFNSRLGDLIFLYENHPYKSFIKEHFLQPTESQFAKLKIQNGHLEKSKNEHFLRPENPEFPITVFHPEHGILVLPAEVYEVLSVTYQHD
jgi:hypothetical protein